ncbi:MAG TPA: gliding motility-associated C-terminal domain-containing protein, partial [Mucilaginibacter sp.]
LIKVTAQDGLTTNTYAVTVTRAPSAVATLSYLSPSQGSLSPVFGTGILNYTALIDNAISSLTVTPTLTDATATIKVNGTPVSNNAASGIINLNVGSNTITIEVTAQDGITKQTYTWVVERGIPPAAITATNILSPNGDGKNDTWVIKELALYPNNTVTVYDRAGRIVYNKVNYTNDWGGTFQGSPLAEDTYYYVVNLGPDRAQIRGFITIIRNRR